MASNAAIDHALGCCFRISPAWISLPTGTKSRLSPGFACSSSLRDRLLLNTGGSSSSAGREAFYQPFRPPPGVLESIVSPDEQLQIVRERRGQWHDYGKHIPGLIRSGFTPATLDEATGITGVEQNQIIVACQVRDTLVSTGMSERSLAFFDSGGAAVLYELRILSAQQRRVAAEFVIERAMDAKSARDLARALKDFDRRKRDFGWDFFASDPGDCLAFWWYRQSKELKDTEREEALRKALQFTTSDSSRGLISSLLGDKSSPSKAVATVEKSKAPTEELVRVVRLEYGETAGLVMLPVADAEASSIRAAPCGRALGEGVFRIHRSSTAWTGWVPLPGWKPVLDAVSPITVFFPDARAMRLQRKERRQIAQGGDEASEVLLLVDKGSTLVIKPASIYLVAAEGGRLSIESGRELPSDVDVLAEVILALSPPGEQEQEDDPIDWD